MEKNLKTMRRLVSALILTVLLVAAVLAIMSNNWSSLFVIGSAFLLSLIPFVLDRYFQIHISGGLKFGITIFLFGTLFLGEVNHFYDEYFWWDTLLHFWAGFGLTIFGFIMLKEIYAQSELRSLPSMTTLFAFSFTGMMAAMWEVYEFIIDLTDLSEGEMQPSNFDTMIDIIVALAAAAIVCVFGYLHLRGGHRNFASRMIERTDLKLKQILK